MKFQPKDTKKVCIVKFLCIIALFTACVGKQTSTALARVVELVDASDSKSDPERGAGSIPAPGTMNTKNRPQKRSFFSSLNP